MKTRDVVKKINGIQTIKSIMSILNINKSKAIYLVYKLRKKGYVITKQDSHHSRIYFISSQNLLGGESYLDILNKYSPIKISSSEVYKIYGRNISIEETIIYSIKTHKFRYILSSLALFKRIENWSELYNLSKRNNLIREVGALYELIESNFPKVKKINKKFLNIGLPNKDDNFNYIIPNIKSKDFHSIEEKWKVYIPFNKEDLMEYKNDFYKRSNKSINRIRQQTS